MWLCTQKIFPTSTEYQLIEEASGISDKFKIQYNMVYTIQCSFVKFKRIPRTWAWGVFQKYNFNLPFGDNNLSFGSVRGCLHDTGTSFIDFIPCLHGSHCTGMTQCFMLTLILASHFGTLLSINTHGSPIPVNSATHLTQEQNFTSPLQFMIPVQNVVRFHTDTNILHRYKNWSELVPL